MKCHTDLDTQSTDEASLETLVARLEECSAAVSFFHFV